MPQPFSAVDFSNILQLPKEKAILDFIRQKLIEKNKPDRTEIITQLLEMHRTSTGFDPANFSKVRFKRIKSSAFRQILSEINTDLGLILNMSEYREYIRKHDHSKMVFEKLQGIKTKISENDFTSAESDIRQLKDILMSTEDHSILLALQRLFQSEPVKKISEAETFLRNLKMKK